MNRLLQSGNAPTEDIKKLEEIRDLNREHEIHKDEAQSLTATIQKLQLVVRQNGMILFPWKKR